jgi:ABC-2 type transport system ATP-binding protein
MTLDSSVIAAHGLGFDWRGGAGAALDGVSLQVAAGERVALLGPNGAGKSTLLRLLAGRLTPSRGDVQLFGGAAKAAAGRLAYLPQEITLDPEMTAGETLELIAALLGLPGKAARIARVATLFGLGSRLAVPVAELSGGYKRRLDLALFLLEERELLLLDEPAAGLDAEGEGILLAELERRAAAGAAVVLAGHDLGWLSRFTRRALLLVGGRLAAEAAPEEFTAAAAGVRAGGARGAGRGGGNGGGGGRF